MKQKITMLIDAEIVRVAKRTASQERRPINELIQEALVQYLRKGFAQIRRIHKRLLCN